MNPFKKKEERRGPFVEGDIVYHRIWGKAIITEVLDRKYHPYRFMTQGRRIEQDGAEDADSLSFEPWPEHEPVHKRPFKKGWYICCVGESTKYEVRYLTVEHIDHTLFVYIGEDMPKELP